MTRKRPMHISERRRTHVLDLLDGGLILQAEAAQLLGVARQLIHQWCRAERIDPVWQRRQYLKELMREK
jgi:hypothetical protein